MTVANASVLVAVDESDRLLQVDKKNRNRRDLSKYKTISSNYGKSIKRSFSKFQMLKRQPRKENRTGWYRIRQGLSSTFKPLSKRMEIETRQRSSKRNISLRNTKIHKTIDGAPKTDPTTNPPGIYHNEVPNEFHVPRIEHLGFLGFQLLESRKVFTQSRIIKSSKPLTPQINNTRLLNTPTNETATVQSSNIVDAIYNNHTNEIELSIKIPWRAIKKLEISATDESQHKLKFTLEIYDKLVKGKGAIDPENVLMSMMSNNSYLASEANASLICKLNEETDEALNLTKVINEKHSEFEVNSDTHNQFFKNSTVPQDKRRKLQEFLLKMINLIWKHIDNCSYLNPAQKLCYYHVALEKVLSILRRNTEGSH